MKTKISYSAGFSAISLIVALGFAVVIGIGVFFLSKNSPSQTEPFSLGAVRRPQPSNSETLTSGELTTTIPDIVGHGQNLECDFKIPLDGTQNPFRTGKLWTTSSKGRSTLNAEVSGMAIEANAIYQNNRAYAWMIVGEQKMGMKFSPSSVDEINRSMTPQERQQAEQVRASMLFTCHPWIPDETKFILPPDVKFEER